MKRRHFIQQSSLLLAGTVISQPLWAKSKQKPLVGLQLYSVRDDMRKDPAGTLKAVADLGYKYIEHANYVNHQFYGYKPSAFKELLDGLGLKMPSGHTVMDASHWNGSTKQCTDSWKKTIDDAAFMGQEIVITPSIDEGLRKNYDLFMKFLEAFNASAQLCQQAGMKFGYHNHDFEFTEKLNGTVLYDLMLQNTDPIAVQQQMDTGNMYHGGASAIEWLKKYPGRFYSFHVKDAVIKKDANHTYENTILGQGEVPVKLAMELAVQQGTVKHFIIEQEQYQGQPPLECMRQNLAAMRQWGYGKA